jgi:rod shape-determining protein MreC
MENLISRYRNVTILAVILFVQVLGLAVQVKRTTDDESTRLIRVWTVGAIAPLEKAIVWCQGGLGNLWRSYVYLRGVRQENRELKFEIERLRLEQVRMTEDAQQGRRLQALLGFKEQFIAKTVAAQVIGSSGSEQSRSIYIDKGTSDGVEKDMAVITAEGVVGKVLRAYGSTAQVLLINDQSSGVGVILDKSRLQGVVRGTPGGEVALEKVMTDEQVAPGERVMTSGGDQIFPKGLTVGYITKVTPGADLFLSIRIRPSANLSKLEEVLVITTKEDRAPAVADTGKRAVDILTQRLPSVPDSPPAGNKVSASETPANTATPDAVKTKPVENRGVPAAEATRPISPVRQSEVGARNPAGSLVMSGSAGAAVVRQAAGKKPAQVAPGKDKDSEQATRPVSDVSRPKADPAPAKTETPEAKPQ